MSVAIAPDYMQFVFILFWMYVIRAILYIIGGMARADKDIRTCYNATDAISGIIMLIIAAWVAF